VPQSQSGPFGEEIKFLPLMRIEPQFLGLTDHMLVIIRTVQNRLLLVKRKFNILSRYMLQWKIQDLANDGYVRLKLEVFRTDLKPCHKQL